MAIDLDVYRKQSRETWGQMATGWEDRRDWLMAITGPVNEWLTGYYRLDAVRAHLLEMAGDTKAAMAHYRAAAHRTTNLAEQHYLATQAARLRVETASDDVPPN